MGIKGFEDSTLFTLKIPSINLVENVYPIDSVFNHVDYHVQILKESHLEKNFILLAAHSGRGKTSYFNRVVELQIGDFIWIYYYDKILCFQVEELFYISKNGYFELNSDIDCDTLFLITCSLIYFDKQVVVQAKLIYF